MSGMGVWDTEYWYWRSTGLDHHFAKQRATDYYRRYSSKELTFFPEDDTRFSHTENPVEVMELREVVDCIIQNIASDFDLNLFIIILKLTGVDKVVGIEIFDGIESYEEMQLPPMIKEDGSPVVDADGNPIPDPTKMTHKKLAKLAGFSVRDKALKSYNLAFCRLRRLMIDKGLAPDGASDHWGLPKTAMINS